MMEEWLHRTIILIICLHLLLQIWEMKEFFFPNHGEKFSLTIQGSHQRRPSRHRTKMYGVTVSDKVTIEYNRNPDGMMVYFGKVREGSLSSKTSPYCQPFSLPLKGWFTFFQVLIALTLVTITLVYYLHSFNKYYMLKVAEMGVDPFYKDHLNSVLVNELGSYPSLLFILLILASLLQIPVVMSTYYRAEDCGFYMIWLGYTRWFKHTNTYTDLIQQRIQAKYGDRFKEEGDQLDSAIKQYPNEATVDGVTYRDVGPATTKRYQDQLVLLHLLLAQEHDQVCKEVFPEKNIDGKGVSFTLTAHEIDTLHDYAEKIMESELSVEVIARDSEVGSDSNQETNKGTSLDSIVGSRD